LAQEAGNRENQQARHPDLGRGLHAPVSECRATKGLTLG